MTARLVRRAVGVVVLALLAGLAYAQGGAGLPGVPTLEHPTQDGGGGVPAYVREAFGDGWASSGGCDTRNRVLARDLDRVELEPGSDCVVVAGVLTDPYTGERVTFTRGTTTSHQVQIDHVLPLAQAWYAGAHAWTAQQRVAFANDPANLVAAAGGVNAAKSDATLAEYAPTLSGAALCRYVATYTSVADSYGLTLSAADRDVAEQTRAGCA